MRILVVDDFFDSVSIMSKLLARVGYDVRIAIDGEEALQIAPDFLPEVALLDIGLPNMDGYEVAKRLRQLPNPVRLRIIVISGTAPNVARCQDAGIDDYLLKPSAIKEIIRAIHSEQTGQILACAQAN